MAAADRAARARDGLLELRPLLRPPRQGGPAATASLFGYRLAGGVPPTFRALAPTLRKLNLSQNAGRN